jgi:DNA-binding response OmpR family regulator
MYSHIPIIMTSALPSARVRCLQAGADQFIGKPFDMEDLLQMLSIATKSS